MEEFMKKFVPDEEKERKIINAIIADPCEETINNLKAYAAKVCISRYSFYFRYIVEKYPEAKKVIKLYLESKEKNALSEEEIIASCVLVKE